MPTRLAALARRRPGLVMLAALYVTLAAVVARSPLTVALCIALVATLVVQVVVAVAHPMTGSRAR